MLHVYKDVCLAKCADTHTFYFTHMYKDIYIYIYMLCVCARVVACVCVCLCGHLFTYAFLISLDR